VAGLEQQLINTIQYNTINTILYTRPRLIVMSQVIGYKRIPKFISSGWDVFKSLTSAYAVRGAKIGLLQTVVAVTT